MCLQIWFYWIGNILCRCVKVPLFIYSLIFQVLYYSFILIVFVYLQMWMSVPLTPITVILMPTALTQTEASHVPANLVLVDREHRVLVS